MCWVCLYKKDQIELKDTYSKFSMESLAHKFSWYQKTWYYDFPMKLKFFSVLVLHNNVLTWNNLTHSGFYGYVWVLKNMHHLCFLCAVAIEVWEGALNLTNINGN